jgi:peptidoglycan/xylan/chitin deacetylase (PgdA/CDA1 family)
LNQKYLYFLTSVLITIYCLSVNLAAVASRGAIPETYNPKVVILNFDDNRKTQFIEAKPILDKYGFKATFYVVCKYLDNKKGYMNWTQLETLYKEGHDIGSHTMNHDNLTDSSKKSLEYQIGKSKECLREHGINATSFAYPFDKGWDNKTVVKVLSKY